MDVFLQAGSLDFELLLCGAGPVCGLSWGGGWKTDSAAEHTSRLTISANISLLKVGARLRVKWADLEFAFRVTTVFS